MFDRDYRGGSDHPKMSKRFPAFDPDTPREDQGIYQKYVVNRTDETDHTGCKHHGCEYFVLDLDHDEFAFHALRAYAEACQKKYPFLAQDLRNQAIRLELKIDKQQDET